ncbi:hypothetical protein Tco_1463798, partial [Tanacetum coccineum]
PKKARKFKKPASPKLKNVPVLPKEPTKKLGKAKKDVTSTKKTATKPKPTKKKTPIKADNGKGLNVLSEVALSEASQLKEVTKRSKKYFHISYASGSGDGTDFESEVPDEQQGKISSTNEGTGTKPGVPDVPKYEFERGELREEVQIGREWGGNEMLGSSGGSGILGKRRGEKKRRGRGADVRNEVARGLKGQVRCATQSGGSAMCAKEGVLVWEIAVGGVERGLDSDFDDDEDDDEDDDDNDGNDDGDDNDDDNDGNDDDDSDHERTESDRDENSNINQSNEEHEEEEEEYVDEFTNKDDDDNAK